MSENYPALNLTISADEIAINAKQELNAHNYYNDQGLDALFNAMIDRAVDGMSAAIARAIENAAHEVYHAVQIPSRCESCGSVYEVPELREEIKNLEGRLAKAMNRLADARKELEAAKAPWDTMNGLAGMSAGAGDS